MFTIQQIQVIEEYKRKYPDESNRVLTTKLLNTGLFPDVAYDTLRVNVGKYFNYKALEMGEYKEFAANEIELVASYYEPPKSIEVEGIIGIINDIHLPFQDNRAINIALNCLLDVNVDYLLLNGDILDCQSVSRFHRDVNFRDVNNDIHKGNRFLDYLQSKFSKIIFKEGNHETRIRKYIALHSPELGNLDNLKIENMLRLEQRGIQFIDHRGYVKAGKLNIIHGDELPGGGYHIAWNKIMKAGTDVAFGNFHKTQNAQKVIQFKNEVIRGYSIGCLCGLNPEYLKWNEWNNGFAYVEVQKDGNYNFHNIKIINYKVVY